MPSWMPAGEGIGAGLAEPLLEAGRDVVGVVEAVDLDPRVGDPALVVGADDGGDVAVGGVLGGGRGVVGCSRVKDMRRAQTRDLLPWPSVAFRPRWPPSAKRCGRSRCPRDGVCAAPGAGRCARGSTSRTGARRARSADPAAALRPASQIAAVGDRLVDAHGRARRHGPRRAVLDIGCGPGRTAAALTRRLSPSASYEGFDVMPKSIALVHEGDHQALPELPLPARRHPQRRVQPVGGASVPPSSSSPTTTTASTSPSRPRSSPTCSRSRASATWRRRRAR